VIASKGSIIRTVAAQDPKETMGVNDRAQLADAAQELRARKNEKLMAAGVTIEDPSATYIEDGVEVGPDTVIRPNTYLLGDTRIGKSCNIGPSTQIVDSVIDDGAVVTFAVLDQVEVGRNCSVGPFAYLRPGSRLEAGSKAGTFVEINRTTIGEGTKIPHLSYLGDAEIGKDANIGAGTITGNYDGETGVKSKTVIEDEVLTGSGTTIVAPAKLGKGAVTGAGSVVTKPVESEEVVVGIPAKPVRKRRRKEGSANKRGKH
jgi:bifunctional UDP-N-acetylglucosamine pyrophosphorylase/glucosamine-1-phosphate N-acetyltransferase